jgi:CxxC motif-containing protein
VTKENIMKKDIVCIVCPRGCTIQVNYDKNGIISMEGSSCKRGDEYARAEILSPTRMITSSVKIDNAKYTVCPVKTGAPVSKSKIFDVMEEIYKVRIKAPVQQGDVIIKDVCGTGADIIATQTFETES